eukprot:6258413-Pyramimonas_sp.AAC.1
MGLAPLAAFYTVWGPRSNNGGKLFGICDSWRTNFAKVGRTKLKASAAAVVGCNGALISTWTYAIRKELRRELNPLESDKVA